jgi:hypothetical protein
MKFAEPRPYADPEKAAQRIPQLANAFEPILEGRIYAGPPFLGPDLLFLT